MKTFLLSILLFFSISASAKTEDVFIEEADDYSNEAIVRVGYFQDRWYLELDYFCRLNWYVNFTVKGEWNFDPKSSDAQLILSPNQTCKIWYARRLP